MSVVTRETATKTEKILKRSVTGVFVQLGVFLALRNSAVSTLACLKFVIDLNNG